MKIFEISSKKNKNGRRRFKAILHTIFPDSCVDEINQVGTLYNKNGITWLREPCEKALGSIEGMSIRCEFVDDERTEILSHGDTEIIDGEPVYENAVVIGTFTKGYIDEIKIDNDETITACIGEGEIDAQCYHNFVTKMESDIARGIHPSGSVELMHTEDNKEIIYKYGYKDKGRIPQEFVYSGYALIGITPADDSAKLVELNKKNKEDLDKMTEKEIKEIVSQTISELSAQNNELDKCKAECEAKVKEANANLEKVVTEKNELVASSEEIKAALEAAKAETKELDEKYNAIWEERQALEKALGEAKARERINAMNTAVANFSKEEKEYAKAEIDAFKDDPISNEIANIVSKIWEGIGKAAKAKADADAEKNASKNENIEDIFSEVIDSADTSVEDINIF